MERIPAMTLFGLTIPTGLNTYLICSAIALVLGIPTALCYTVRNTRYSKSFAFALFALPFAVTTVLMMVGNQIGAAVTISGVFALVRFRSLPCSAKELVSVFMSMIIGVSTANRTQDGILVALIFTVLSCLVTLLFNCTNIGEPSRAEKTLRITIPESLDYTEVFDDLFERYTATHELVRVKTTNMGSMFQLTYAITLKDQKEERAFLNDLRCRNGNLDIICAKNVVDEKEL